MKQIIITLLICISIPTIAQTKYEKAMIKAFTLWKGNKVNEASRVFERISQAEKDKWLPAYYTATTEIVSSFGLKDENQLNAKLEKAQSFLDKAASISPNNAEIIIMKALLNTAYISFDARKYGMTLSAKNTELYAKAIKLAPKNPRVVLGRAEWNMGSAQYFKQPITPYCKEVKRAIALAEKEVLAQFYPRFDKQRALSILKKCKL